ncbi:MAG: DUF805 domain-containing protein [Candidatus Nanopelagicaceae bacterium]
MSMIEAINDALRRFTDFKGRSNRKQYLSFLLFYILVDLFINLANPNGTTINAIIMGAMIVPLIAVEIRRSHDVGKSGWWILVPFYSIYLMFKESIPETPEPPSSL